MSRAQEAAGKLIWARERSLNLCREAGCAAPEGLPSAQARAEEAAQVAEAIERIEQQILERGGGRALDDIVSDVVQLTSDQLSTELALVERHIEDLEARKENLEQIIGAERNELGHMDGSGRAAAAAERMQASLARIREGVQEYARLKLASLMLKRQVERYRAGHQAPLLKRGSQLFATLTCGSFEGLGTDFDERDQPVIVGIRSFGQTVGIDGMSEGTRDQLHLALRLAAIEEHLHRQLLPVVFDDILINFDDQRAAATLEALGELARRTQVLFFTHHRRLVDLATIACPDQVTLHELPARAS